MNTKTILYAVLAVTLTACSSDSDPQDIGGREIQLFTQVDGVTRAPDVAADLQDLQFKNGTKISVKVKEDAATPSVDYALALYTADGSGGLSLPTGEKQYYPANGNGVNIYAYHPAGAVSVFEVKTDQSSTDNYVASDLMYASLAGVTSASTNHTLEFSHLLSKIIVQLVQGSSVSATDMAAATITVGSDDLITSGTFTAASGTFSPDASGTGTITIATNADTDAHAASIVPQGMGGKKINVTINDVTKSYTIADGVTFQAGYKYTYIISVGATELTLVSTQITNWNDASGNTSTGQLEI